MKLVGVTKKFATDDASLDYLESIRWPNGEIGCVHSGEVALKVQDDGVLGRSYLVRSGEKSANEMARSSSVLGANPCSAVIHSA